MQKGLIYGALQNEWKERLMFMIIITEWTLAGTGGVGGEAMGRGCL